MGLMCCVFLAAIDQVCSLFPLIEKSFCQSQLPKTIVATALPTIVAQLGGGGRYSWVGTYVTAFRNWHLQSDFFLSFARAYLLAAAR